MKKSSTTMKSALMRVVVLPGAIVFDKIPKPKADAKDEEKKKMATRFVANVLAKVQDDPILKLIVNGQWKETNVQTFLLQLFNNQDKKSKVKKEEMGMQTDPISLLNSIFGGLSSIVEEEKEADDKKIEAEVISMLERETADDDVDKLFRSKFETSDGEDDESDGLQSLQQKDKPAGAANTEDELQEEELKEDDSVVSNTTTTSVVTVPAYIPVLSSAEEVKKYSSINKLETQSYKSLIRYLQLNGLISLYSQLQEIRASYDEKLRAKQEARIKQDNKLQSTAIAYLTDEADLRRRVILKTHVQGLYKFSDNLTFKMWVKNVYIAYTAAAVKAIEVATQNLRSTYPTLKRPDFAKFKTNLRRFIYSVCIVIMGQVTTSNPATDLQHYLMQLIQEIDFGTRATIINDVWDKVKIVIDTFVFLNCVETGSVYSLRLLHAIERTREVYNALLIKFATKARQTVTNVVNSNLMDYTRRIKMLIESLQENMTTNMATLRRGPTRVTTQLFFMNDLARFRDLDVSSDLGKYLRSSTAEVVINLTPSFYDLRDVNKDFFNIDTMNSSPTMFASAKVRRTGTNDWKKVQRGSGKKPTHQNKFKDFNLTHAGRADVNGHIYWCAFAVMGLPCKFKKRCYGAHSDEYECTAADIKSSGKYHRHQDVVIPGAKSFFQHCAHNGSDGYGFTPSIKKQKQKTATKPTAKKQPARQSDKWVPAKSGQAKKKKSLRHELSDKSRVKGLSSDQAKQTALYQKVLRCCQGLEPWTVSKGPDGTADVACVDCGGPHWIEHCGTEGDFQVFFPTDAYVPDGKTAADFDEYDYEALQRLSLEQHEAGSFNKNKVKRTFMKASVKMIRVGKPHTVVESPLASSARVSSYHDATAEQSMNNFKSIVSHDKTPLSHFTAAVTEWDRERTDEDPDITPNVKKGPSYPDLKSVTYQFSQKTWQTVDVQRRKGMKSLKRFDLDKFDTRVEKLLCKKDATKKKVRRDFVATAPALMKTLRGKALKGGVRFPSCIKNISNATRKHVHQKFMQLFREQGPRMIAMADSDSELTILSEYWVDGIIPLEMNPICMDTASSVSAPISKGGVLPFSVDSSQGTAIAVYIVPSTCNLPDSEIILPVTVVAQILGIFWRNIFQHTLYFNKIPIRALTYRIDNGRMVYFNLKKLIQAFDLVLLQRGGTTTAKKKVHRKLIPAHIHRREKPVPTVLKVATTRIDCVPDVVAAAGEEFAHPSEEFVLQKCMATSIYGDNALEFAHTMTHAHQKSLKRAVLKGHLVLPKRFPITPAALNKYEKEMNDKWCSSCTTMLDQPRRTYKSSDTSPCAFKVMGLDDIDTPWSAILLFAFKRGLVFAIPLRNKTKSEVQKAIDASVGVVNDLLYIANASETVKKNWTNLVMKIRTDKAAVFKAVVKDLNRVFPNARGNTKRLPPDSQYYSVAEPPFKQYKALLYGTMKTSGLRKNEFRHAVASTNVAFNLKPQACHSFTSRMQRAAQVPFIDLNQVRTKYLPAGLKALLTTPKAISKPGQYFTGEVVTILSRTPGDNATHEISVRKDGSNKVVQINIQKLRIDFTSINYHTDKWRGVPKTTTTTKIKRKIVPRSTVTSSKTNVPPRRSKRKIPNKPLTRTVPRGQFVLNHSADYGIVIGATTDESKLSSSRYVFFYHDADKTWSLAAKDKEQLLRMASKAKTKPPPQRIANILNHLIAFNVIDKDDVDIDDKLNELLYYDQYTPDSSASQKTGIGAGKGKIHSIKIRSEKQELKHREKVGAVLKTVVTKLLKAKSRPREKRHVIADAKERDEFVCNTSKMSSREILNMHPDIIQECHNSAACSETAEVRRVNVQTDNGGKLGPIPETRNVEKLFDNIKKYVRKDQQEPLKKEIQDECLGLWDMGIGKMVDESEVPFDDPNTIVTNISVVITQKQRPQPDGTKKEGWKFRAAAAGHKMNSGYENTTAPTPAPVTTFISIATGVYLDWHEFSYDVTKAYPTSKLPEHIIGTRFVRVPSWWWYRNKDNVPIQRGSRKRLIRAEKGWYGFDDAGNIWRLDHVKILESVRLYPTVTDPAIFVRPDTDPSGGAIVDVATDDGHGFVEKEEAKFEIFDAYKKFGRVITIDAGPPSKWNGIDLDRGIDQRTGGAFLHISTTSSLSKGIAKLEADYKCEFPLQYLPVPRTITAMDLYSARAELGKADRDLMIFMFRTLGVCLFSLTHGLRIDISFALHILSPHSVFATETHVEAMAHLLGYLKYRMDERLGVTFKSARFSQIKYPKLIISTDASLANVGIKTGYGIVIEWFGSMVYCASGSLKCIVLFTSMAEFLAHTIGLRLGKSSQNFTREIGFASEIVEPMTRTQLSKYAERDRMLLLLDNMAAAKVALTGVSNKRMKHMDLKEAFVYQSVGRQHDLKFQPGEFMCADMNSKDIKNRVEHYMKGFRLLSAFTLPKS